jgi:hypothetical protein
VRHKTKVGTGFGEHKFQWHQDANAGRRGSRDCHSARSLAQNRVHGAKRDAGGVSDDWGKRGDWTMIVIIDTGTGIPREFQ